MNLLHFTKSWWAIGLFTATGFVSQGDVFAQSLPPSPVQTNTLKDKAAPVSTDKYRNPTISSANGDAATLVSPVPVPDDGIGTTIVHPSGSVMPISTPCDPCKPAEKGSTNRYANLPVQNPMPQLGYFPVAPKGPGYYSLKDLVSGTERPAPPKYGYPPFGLLAFSNYDANWKYLDDPNNTNSDYFDFLKRQRFGPDDCLMWTMGGDFRARYAYEGNSRALNNITPPPPLKFRGRDNTYDLFRVRLYNDIQITETVRIFAEVFAAFSPDYLFPPLPFDRNNADFLNLFADIQLFQMGNEAWTLRVGRQELLYGSQRLISPLEWVNSRRTFQGVKTFYRSEKNDFDLFFVQPVVPNINKFDSVDNNIVFGGAWFTHRFTPNNSMDLYYLFLDNTNAATAGRAGVQGGTTVHTVGSRSVGSFGNFLYDFEGMLQFGSTVNQNLFAGAGTAGVGYNMKDLPANPIVWLYYDYASGTQNPGTDNTNSTFNQLSPFGHYYFGFIDIVGRRNIQDLNAVLHFWPQNWLQGQFQVHNFWLASRRDALYNAGGLPIRIDRTGRAGNYVGTEFDFLLNFHMSKHSDILMSYSYMYAGDFLKNTALTNGGRQDPSALYVQYTYRW